MQRRKETQKETLNFKKSSLKAEFGGKWKTLKKRVFIRWPRSALKLFHSRRRLLAILLVSLITAIWLLPVKTSDGQLIARVPPVSEFNTFKREYSKQTSREPVSITTLKELESHPPLQLVQQETLLWQACREIPTCRGRGMCLPKSKALKSLSRQDETWLREKNRHMCQGMAQAWLTLKTTPGAIHQSFRQKWQSLLRAIRSAL